MPLPKFSETLHSDEDHEDLQGHRDAFHVAAVLVTCDFPVRAGQGLKLNYTCTEAEIADKDPREAIVDPYVLGVIEPGSLFWALLIPDMTTGLTHTFAIKGHGSPGDDPEDDDSCRNC